MCIFGRPYKQAVGCLFLGHDVKNEYRHPYRQAMGDALNQETREKKAFLHLTSDSIRLAEAIGAYGQ